MKLLALDTSSVACSVAVQVGDAVCERHEEQPREHTRLLMPMIRSVLDESGVMLTALDAIVLGNGPGSFIGMRIAGSVAQGLAFGAGLGVVPVSSLAAVATEVLCDGSLRQVVVCQDARMNEVYLGIFERGDDGRIVHAAPERLHGQGPIGELRPDGAGTRAAAGFGWQRYPALLAANEALFREVSAVQHPRARHLLPLGAVAAADGRAVAPEALNPAYLRQKVAARPSAGP